MKIRQAVSTDSLLLSSLCMDVQSLHAKHYPDLFKMPDNNEFAVSFFNGMLADPMITILISKKYEQALGYVFCRLAERPENPFKFAIRYLDIDQISVCPAAQGRGVGTELITQAGILAEKMNVTSLQLNSWGLNIEAHAFFEKMGFEKINHHFWKNL